MADLDIMQEIIAEKMVGAAFEPCELDNQKFVFAMSF
jgi:hypothetical protein